MAASYQIATKPGPRYTHVEITGKVAPGTARRVAQDVIALLVREDAKRALVDVRGLTVRTRVNPVETVETVSSFSDMLDGRSPVKTAVLYKERDQEIMRFYETVALNRGYQMAIFTDMAEAVEWLKV